MELSNPIKTITPSKATAKNAINFVLWAVLSFLIVIAIWFLLFRVRYSWAKIKMLIAVEAKKYQNPLQAEKLLVEGVDAIVLDPGLIRQAMQYSRSTGTPLEQVLVDNAVAMAKQFNYIKPIAITATDNTQQS